MHGAPWRVSALSEQYFRSFLSCKTPSPPRQAYETLAPPPPQAQYKYEELCLQKLLAVLYAERLRGKEALRQKMM